MHEPEVSPASRGELFQQGSGVAQPSELVRILPGGLLARPYRDDEPRYFAFAEGWRFQAREPGAPPYGPVIG